LTALRRQKQQPEDTYDKTNTVTTLEMQTIKADIANQNKQNQ